MIEFDGDFKTPSYINLDIIFDAENLTVYVRDKSIENNNEDDAFSLLNDWLMDTANTYIRIPDKHEDINIILDTCTITIPGNNDCENDLPNKLYYKIVFKSSEDAKLFRLI